MADNLNMEFEFEFFWKDKDFKYEDKKKYNSNIYILECVVTLGSGFTIQLCLVMVTTRVYFKESRSISVNLYFPG